MNRLGTMFLPGMTAALLALSAAGCRGDDDTSFELSVQPKTDGVFSFQTDLRFSGGVDAAGSKELVAMTLAVEEPGTVTSLSFLSTVEAQAVTPTAVTTVATLDSVPPGEPSASMHIDSLGELQPLFESSNTIRLYWTVTLDPAFTAWPAGGIPLRLEIVLGAP
jgi:hypothetical protein